MKIGITTYSFMKYVRQVKCDYNDICDLTKKLGFDGIEFIDIDRVFEQPIGDIMAAALVIREHCEKIGLEIVAYTVGANFLADDIDGELRRIRGCVDIAAALGAKLMRHDAAWGPRKIFGYGYREAIAEMAPLIREIADYAGSKGVKTCTENHGRFFQAPDRVKALIDAVNHPNYGWLIDMGNFMGVDADIIEAVKIAAPYAFHVHAKDNLFKPGSGIAPAGWDPTGGGNYLRATVPGHGVVPIAQCVNIIREAGYDGYVSMEFEGWEDPLKALESGYAYLRKLV
jgi:sugar phosphate isomerase/epimerase